MPIATAHGEFAGVAAVPVSPRTAPASSAAPCAPPAGRAGDLPGQRALRRRQPGASRRCGWCRPGSLATGPAAITSCPWPSAWLVGSGDGGAGRRRPWRPDRRWPPSSRSPRAPRVAAECRRDGLPLYAALATVPPRRPSCSTCSAGAAPARPARCCCWRPCSACSFDHPDDRWRRVLPERHRPAGARGRSRAGVPGLLRGRTTPALAALVERARRPQTNEVEPQRGGGRRACERPPPTGRDTPVALVELGPSAGPATCGPTPTPSTLGDGVEPPGAGLGPCRLRSRLRRPPARPDVDAPLPPVVGPGRPRPAPDRRPPPTCDDAALAGGVPVARAAPTGSSAFRRRGRRGHGGRSAHASSGATCSTTCRRSLDGAPGRRPRLRRSTRWVLTYVADGDRRPRARRRSCRTAPRRPAARSLARRPRRPAWCRASTGRRSRGRRRSTVAGPRRPSGTAASGRSVVVAPPRLAADLALARLAAADAVRERSNTRSCRSGYAGRRSMTVMTRSDSSPLPRQPSVGSV